MSQKYAEQVAAQIISSVSNSVRDKSRTLERVFHHRMADLAQWVFNERSIWRKLDEEPHRRLGDPSVYEPLLFEALRRTNSYNFWVANKPDPLGTAGVLLPHPLLANEPVKIHAIDHCLHLCGFVPDFGILESDSLLFRIQPFRDPDAFISDGAITTSEELARAFIDAGLFVLPTTPYLDDTQVVRETFTRNILKQWERNYELGIRGYEDAILRVPVKWYAHAAVNYDEVARFLKPRIDALVPTTPRGIDFIMPTHAEMIAAGDDEIYKYSIGMWILDKRQWDAERNWQRSELARRKRGVKAKLPEHNRAVMHFPDKSYVVELSPETMPEESDRMGHCIGDPSMGYIGKVKEGKIRAFSFRNKSGESVYTLEAKLDLNRSDKPIVGFPQVKSFSNRTPRGTSGAGRNDARFVEDTPQHLANVIQFISEYADVDPNTVNDLSYARAAHPELFEPFKRKNPGYSRRHARDARHNPTYSFDEPWYPRE